jgi:Na+-driven multidrug efflux pump
MLLGRPIAGLFTDDPVIIDHATTYFRVVGWSFPAFGLLSMAAAVFNGVQKTGRALQVLLVKSLLFTVPVAFIGAAFGVIWVFLALAIGNLLGAIYAGRVLHRSLAEARAAPSPATVYGDDLRRLVLGRRPPSDSADI